MEIKIINRSRHALPSYESLQAAGMDIRANVDKPVVLPPLGRALIKTGLFIALPEGYEAQIRPRSGLAIKKGITCLNSPGTIDADYRGEIMVALHNHSDEARTVEVGERVAQIALLPFLAADFDVVDELSDTTRGAGGFGSTGRK